MEWVTRLIAVTVTVLCVLIAVPFAFFMARVAPARIRAFLVAAVLVPLWASYLVKAYAWRTMVQPGGVLESAARELYVHPNTVRYRLRRVAEVTGLSPLDGRDAFALRMALTVGRLDPAV